VIVASNDLDETIIASLKDQGATIAVWGVGTKLATAYDQPALGGVYKLAAVRQRGRDWQYKVKLSEQAIKTSSPGILQVRRHYLDGQAVADMIFDLERPNRDARVMIDPLDVTRQKKIPPGSEGEDLLVPVFRDGACIYELPSVEAARERAKTQMAMFHPGIKRFVNPHQYPVGLEQGLHEQKMALVLRARQGD
jgi:nicotinate phosphoribosyltransferase